MSEQQQPSAAQPEGLAKTKNQLKNDAKKSAKLEKFAAKQAKWATVAVQDGEGKSRKAAAKSSAAQVAVADETAVGEKKDMSKPMLPAYEPRLVESAWYAWWQSQGFFKPEFDNRTEQADVPRFTMILPPPNVTGSLHLGHAMMGAIEDTLARWHRMRGEAVLFLPGCDHAGIATQAVVEKKLKREMNITKHEIGRREFVAQVWKWKEQYGSRIYEQLKRLGLSVDWDRARFTLDASVNESVNEAFCRLFEEGLVFRANRLVNWSGKLKTALSDLEVDMKEIGPKTMLAAFNHDPKKLYPFGVMWSFAYPLVGGKPGEEIVISTTRPETLFADTAVAVNKKDPRYQHFHGKMVIHPITSKHIPVIVDDVADLEFGTGALKISPAHDPIDFAVGQRHNLPFVSIFDEDNVLNANCGSYAGMQRYDARLAVIEEARAGGLYRGEKDHPMILPVCSRSGDFVEPRMMQQWWLDCKTMADKSMAAVVDGLLRIIPEDQVKVWNNWLGNIRDWCLSRQLWWGHQIPAYKVLVPSSSNEYHELASEAGDNVWVVGRNEDEALDRAKKHHPLARVERDPDVLDTWFSSGLWPFSTLGWPSQTRDMELFYPNSLLETGSDILFFWVARMAMLGVHLTGRVPFSNVFLHSIIRDAHGRKMSKSLGNVIDPIDVIEGTTLEHLHASLLASNLDSAELEKAKAGQKIDFPNGIPECGTDALRFSLCSYVAHGRDVNMNVNEVHAYRRFCNKLWQACRFALMTLGEGFAPDRAVLASAKKGLFGKWILARLNETIDQANQGFRSYVLMTSTKALYSFWLNDLCDVYIEAIKPVVNGCDAEAALASRNVLFKCIHDGLLLLHPIMPFVTEELYQRLPKYADDQTPAACVAVYPAPCAYGLLSDEEQCQFDRLVDTVKEIRSIASDRSVPRGSSIHLSGSECGYSASMAALVRAVGTLSIGSKTEDNRNQPIHECQLASNPEIKVAFYPRQPE